MFLAHTDLHSFLHPHGDKLACSIHKHYLSVGHLGFGRLWFKFECFVVEIIEDLSVGFSDLVPRVCLLIERSGGHGKDVVLSVEEDIEVWEDILLVDLGHHSLATLFGELSSINFSKVLLLRA